MSTQVAAPGKKRKRGRETALDMVRSLGLVVLIVVPVWFFAKAPASDSVELREVDPAADIAAFSAEVPAAPVPAQPPAGWRPTVTSYFGGTAELRVGYVTAQQQYVEYTASEADPADFLPQAVGPDAEQLAPVTVDGTAWDHYREADGSQSLVRVVQGATVVVGSLRATASLEELEVLVRALSAG